MAMPGAASLAQTRIFHQSTPEPTGQPVQSGRTLPFRCRVQGTIGVFDYLGYHLHCLRDLVEDVSLIPPECLSMIEIQRGLLRYYVEQCMLDNGWVVGAPPRRTD